MKKIIICLFIVLPAVIMTGCVKGEDLIFNGTATERMTAALKEYREILVSSENGWALDYYTQKKQANRGTTILCKFHENGTVDVASIDDTNKAAREVASSDFDMLGTQGPVLSFSEYNPVLHYYCEPSTSNIEGLEIGDYEFVLLSHSENEIILKGKKWSNYMILTRLESSDWNTYFENAVNNALINNYITRVATLTVNGQVYESEVSGKKYYVTDKSGKTLEIVYTVTNNGLRFYKYVDIDGVEMRNFTYNPQTLEYVCTDPGVNAKISITFKDQYNDILSGVARYRVSLPFCSPDLATRFETAIAGMGTRRVQAMYMGYSTISGYPFSAFVMPYTSGTSSYNSIFKMVMEPVANTPDQIAIASYETGTPPGLNTGNFVSRFSPIFNDMVSKSPYVVKGDDPDLLYAGTIQLVSVADPSFIIGLYY